MIQTEHNIGDSYCRIVFDGLKPVVRECADDTVASIHYSKDCYGTSVRYTTKGRVELYKGMEQNGLFWTKEEAEAWLATLPKNIPFKSGSIVFYVEKKKTGVCLDIAQIMNARVKDGKIYYEIFVRERLYITENDIGSKVFLTYADAKTYRDKLEAEMYGA